MHNLSVKQTKMFRQRFNVTYIRDNDFRQVVFPNFCQFVSHVEIFPFTASGNRRLLDAKGNPRKVLIQKPFVLKVRKRELIMHERGHSFRMSLSTNRLFQTITTKYSCTSGPKGQKFCLNNGDQKLKKCVSSGANCVSARNAFV